MVQPSGTDDFDFSVGPRRRRKTPGLSQEVEASQAGTIHVSSSSQDDLASSSSENRSFSMADALAPLTCVLVALHSQPSQHELDAIRRNAQPELSQTTAERSMEGTNEPDGSENVPPSAQCAHFRVADDVSLLTEVLAREYFVSKDKATLMGKIAVALNERLSGSGDRFTGRSCGVRLTRLMKLQKLSQLRSMRSSGACVSRYSVVCLCFACRHRA